MTQTPFISIGECMVELAPEAPGIYRRGFAGDTMNTAWYLAREGVPVSYATRVGTDEISGKMVDFMQASGIGTDLIARDPDRTVGLYMIDLKEGERSFSYWRGQAAAKLIARDRGWLEQVTSSSDKLFFSGITLAVLETNADRKAFLDQIASARAKGATITFDPNLRPRLWRDTQTMCNWLSRAARVSDITLPSFEDEAQWFGDADIRASLQRYRRHGASTVVIKNGAEEVLAWDAREGEARFTPTPTDPVDTTAAGDSFNAGFLAARYKGAALGDAIAAGSKLAARVVSRRGALVD